MSTDREDGTGGRPRQDPLDVRGLEEAWSRSLPGAESVPRCLTDQPRLHRVAAHLSLSAAAITSYTPATARSARELAPGGREIGPLEIVGRHASRRPQRPERTGALFTERFLARTLTPSFARSRFGRFAGSRRGTRLDAEMKLRATNVA